MRSLCPLFLLVNIVFALPATAQNWTELSAEAHNVLRRYVQINTTNPPGNEARGAEYLASVLREHGIESQLIPIAPNRSAVYARVAGDGSERPLILLSHIDVVPADASHWVLPPFSAAEQGGAIYGRGTVDTKTLGVEELFAVIALKQSGAARHRDVIFLATPDEEAGGQVGAGWIVKNRRDLLRNAEFVLNEGGGVEDIGGHPLAMVETTQKLPVWIRITATDQPRHGSQPPPNYSVLRLLDALNRIHALQFEPRVLPQTRGLFAAIASEESDPELRQGFANLDAAIHSPAFWQALEHSPRFPWFNSMLRTTISLTRLEGSNKINVIPPEATAEIDCRVLPVEDTDQFTQRVREAAGDPQHIRVEQLMAFKPNTSSSETAAYKAIAEVAQRSYPGIKVVQALETGFTDSHYFREIGIQSYGWDAVERTSEESATAHGNNERVRIESFEKALPVFYAVVEQIAR